MDLHYIALFLSMDTCHIHTHVHTLMADAALQGADLLIKRHSTLKHPMIFHIHTDTDGEHLGFQYLKHFYTHLPITG